MNRFGVLACRSLRPPVKAQAFDMNPQTTKNSFKLNYQRITV
jgi:hypothetical protein